MRQRLTCAIVAGAALLGVGACNRSEPHEVTNAFQWSDHIPAGGTLHLRDLNGHIRVLPALGPAVQITGSKQWHRGRESDVKFVTNRIGNDVYVCAVWGRGSRCDQHGYTTRRPSIWRIFSLRGRSDMQADLAVSLPAGVRLDVETVNGSTTIEGVASDVRVRAVNGSVSAYSRSGAMSIETVNGSISAGVDSITTPGPFTFAAVHGSVHVVFPATLQGRISLETATGRAVTDFPVSGRTDTHSVEGAIGTGPASVTLRTVNGSVELMRKG